MCAAQKKNAIFYKLRGTETGICYAYAFIAFFVIVAPSAFFFIFPTLKILRVETMRCLDKNTGNAPTKNMQFKITFNLFRFWGCSVKNEFR